MKQEVEVLTQILTKLETDLTNVQNKIDSLSLSVADIENITTQLNKSLYLILNIFQTIVNNKSNMDLLVGATYLLRPFLFYRGLLKSYVAVMHPIPIDIKMLNKKHCDQLLKSRATIVSQFNRLTIPMIGTYYLLVGILCKRYLRKMFNNETTDISTMLSINLIGRKLRMIIKWLFIG